MKSDRKCGICGKESGTRKTCENCTYLIRNGASEDTIRRMLADKATNRIWKEDKATAEKLADAYYESILEEYGDRMKGDSKENFGYNTFAEGINLALDIIMPLLDKPSQDKARAKIEMMISIRKESEAKKSER